MMIKSVEQAVRRSAQLAEDISDTLKKGELHELQNCYEELWHLFDERHKFPSECGAQIAENLSGAVRDLGRYRADRVDYIQLSILVNDARKLSNLFPDSLEITMNFVDLLGSQLAMRCWLSEYDYLDDLVSEVSALSIRFPDDEYLALYMILCVTNLVELCNFAGFKNDAVLSLQNWLEEMLDPVKRRAKRAKANMNRTGILRSLFEEKSDDLGEFMDKSGLSYKHIDNLLNGRFNSIDEKTLEAFSKGLDMETEELRAYLELCNFF